MTEIENVHKAIQPQETLFVVDSMTGQDAVNTAKTFNDRLNFDPASYYGDREADLAMTELFGGFDDRFYQSYRGTWDIDPGYTTRKVLYNLYHVLNHFNLFGGAYVDQAIDMMKRLNAETS